MIEKINNLLPQTQCGQCGFKGCRPYAEAIASGSADIDQCPPGGDEGIAALASLLARPVNPLNPAFGIHKPAQVAVIIEGSCIGCLKCIAACPVDAIIGASKMLHTVLTDECTGCELCLPPCPVNCIEIRPTHMDLTAEQKHQKAQLNKRRYETRAVRLEQQAEAQRERAEKQKAALLKLKQLSKTSQPPTSQ